MSSVPGWRGEGLTEFEKVAKKVECFLFLNGVQGNYKLLKSGRRGEYSVNYCRNLPTCFRLTSYNAHIIW